MRYASQLPELLSNAQNYLNTLRLGHKETNEVVPLISPTTGLNEELLKALMLYDGDVFYSSLIPNYQHGIN